MIHVKNISIGEPRTMAAYQLSKHAGVIWLYSEDGQDWYEMQQHFRGDTLKVAYARNGGVACLSYDVSAINPIGLSVIEIENNTANRQIDLSGYWFFRDGHFVFNYQLKAEDKRKQLLAEADRVFQDKHYDVCLGLISDEEKVQLRAWRDYIQALHKMDLSSVTDKQAFDAIVWAEKPE